MQFPLYLHCKFQDVAARRILHPHARISVGQLAAVARMFKMIENLRGIHSSTDIAMDVV